MRIVGRITAVLIAASVVAACRSDVDKAKERLAFLQKNGASSGEVCDASRAVAKAQADVGDGDAYKTAKLEADVACIHASIGGSDMPSNDQDQIYSMQADNMDAAIANPYPHNDNSEIGRAGWKGE